MKCILMLICLVILTGCVSPYAGMPKQHAVILKREHMLEETGAKVARQGDRVCIILPANIVFSGTGISWASSATHVLNRTISYINAYDKTLIKISAYDSSDANEWHARTLTEERADLVEQYLWRHGIDGRLLVSAGYGNAVPLYATSADVAFEQRVVLCFKALHDARDE